VKFWRSRPESQRVKAEILLAYFAVPRPSQRATAARLHCEQPYVCKMFGKIKRQGAEKALGPEAYEQYKALRDAELSNRHEALAVEWQRSHGQSTPPNESPSQSNHSSSVDTQAKQASQPGPPHLPDQNKAAQREVPTQYVELVRTTTGEVVELHDSAPPSTRPCSTPSSQRGGIPIRCIWGSGREQTDNLLREWAGITGTNRGNSWF